MVNKNLINFLNKISKSKDLISRFFAKKTFKDQYKFAINNSEGGFSENELQQALDITEIYSNKLQKGELSENDLENVAGGGGPNEETTLRSIAMMFGPAVNLVLGGGQIISNWISAKKRYQSEKEALRLAELEIKLEESRNAKKA